jgi:hypothetical protein
VTYRLGLHCIMVYSVIWQICRNIAKICQYTYQTTRRHVKEDTIRRTYNVTVEEVTLHDTMIRPCNFWWEGNGGGSSGILCGMLCVSDLHIFVYLCV